MRTHDHVNIFPTPERYLAPFWELAELLPESGTMVTCVDGALSEEFLARVQRRVLRYGLHTGDMHAIDIVYGERTRFTLVHDGSPVVALETSQLGDHNIQNIIGVAAFVLGRNIVPPARFAEAVASFVGLKRRLDRKSYATEVPIFEGFGSSNEKARSAIAAMKRYFPHRRLVVVFEPHTFSWRNRGTLTWYDTVFAGAHKVYIYEPAEQGATTHEQATQREIVARIRAAGIDASPIGDPATALARIKAQLRRDDCVLLLTSGNLGGLIESIPKAAEEKFPT